MKINFYIITPFAELMEGYLNGSILEKVKKKQKISITYINPRQFTTDRHRTIDDKPFGGGPGMVYKFMPFYMGIQKAKELIRTINNTKKTKTFTILFKPDAPMLNDQFIREFTETYANTILNLILVLPRYEGIDARIEKFVDFSISIGPYVLTGAELPAMVFIDAIVRFIPHSLGNPNSAIQDTSFKIKNGRTIVKKLEAPVYTRPASIQLPDSNKDNSFSVPKILLSGNHTAIKKWQDHFKKTTPVEYLQLKNISKNK